MMDLLEALGDWSDQSPSEVEINYVTELLSRSLKELDEALRRSGSNVEIPRYNLIPVGNSGSECALYAGSDRQLIVGLELLVRFHRQLFVFTDWLAMNYAWQVAPVMGDIPELAVLVDAEVFPSEALRLYSAAAIPGALSSDGYQRSPTESAILGSEELFFKGPENATHVVPKPLLDFEQHMELFDINLAVSRMDGTSSGDHYKLLYYHLMLNCLKFLMAHETAHIELGHIGTTPISITNMREDEVAADVWALELMKCVEQFDLRTLFAVFGFYNRQIFEDTPLDFRTHPLHPDRMLLLATAALRGADSRALRHDIGAGMSIMRTQLESLQIAIPPIGEDETEYCVCNLIPSFYSDMENGAHLRVDISIPTDFQEPDNRFLGIIALKNITFRVRFSLRSMVHPSESHLSGSILIRMRPKIFQIVYGARFGAAMEVLLQAFPEWWLHYPESVFSIESIAIVEAKINFDDQDNPTRIEFEEPALEAFEDLEDVIAVVPDTNSETLLRVAKSAGMSGRASLATAIYENVFAREVSAISYADVINLLRGLHEAERYIDAASIAEDWQKASPALRPGISFTIAVGAEHAEDWSKCIEFATLEMLGIGSNGSYMKDAKNLYEEVLKNIDEPFAKNLMGFHKSYANHEKRWFRFRRCNALKSALNSLRAAQQAIKSDSVYLHQLSGETLIGLKRCGENTAEAARQEFEEVLQIEPRFAPAYIGLATLALIERDINQAHKYWLEAQRTNAFNHFVMDFRTQVEEITVTCARIEQ